jgi:hypothetical protein
MFNTKRASALIMIIIITLGAGVTASAAAPAATALNPVVLSIEAFTVTGDFVMMPKEITVTASSTRSLSDLLNEHYGRERIGLSGGGAISSLDSFQVRESAHLSVHHLITDELIKQEIDFQDSVRNPGFLTGRDFTADSGWMIIVNNSLSDQAPDVLRPQAGQVVRVVFTVFGNGADLGVARTAQMTELPIFPNVNRDEILKAVAASDVVPDYSVISTIANPAVTQGELDARLSELLEELDDIDPPDFTYENGDIGNGNGNGNGYNNGNGSDIVTTTPVTTPPQTQTTPPQTQTHDKIPDRPSAPTGVSIFGIIPLITLLIVLMVVFKRRRKEG